VNSRFIRHRHIKLAAARNNYATGQTILRLHHVQRLKVAVLYTGITGNLPHRVEQHKNKLIPGFTSRYNLTRLVYYEGFFHPDAAINREKEIKGWRRKEDKTHRIDEPALGGPGEGLAEGVQGGGSAAGDP
jgi:predicted GIY-YIG superfamily endonuclease